jgi:hypothetical protein
MDPFLQNQLLELCEFPKDQRWQLKYKASRDGFTASVFEVNCNELAKSFSLIKSHTGNMYGGYNEKEWHSREADVTYFSAFIFDLI